LFATVTDGDIRRALIRGSTLDDTVKHCMHREPVIATSLELAKKKLAAEPDHLRCVPVVDEDGRPTIVVSTIRRTSGLTTALIMAGGFGMVATAGDYPAR